MIPILRILRAAAGSDRDLLDRYIRNRDDEAFEAIVQRYGNGVWAACVRLAGRDADDAFQAVFILLSRKAGTVTGSLPAWLHAVTRRVASTTRRTRRRRDAIETAAARAHLASSTDPTLRESLVLLDEELARLPERYRAVLIVCCLEGRSRDEAAAQLGWSEGQVKGRLERARTLLRNRLARRGVELGGLLLAATMAGPPPVRACPPSAAALTLSHGVIRAMLIQKFRLSAAAIACLGVALAGGLALRAQPAPQEPSVSLAAAPQEKGKATLQEQLDDSKREIESLRKRIDVLEKKLALPPPERPAPRPQKITVTSPQEKDIVVDQRYAARIHAHRHIKVRSLTTGAISEVLVREGQAVKKGEVLFNVLPVIYKAKLEAELAEVQLAKIDLDNTKKLVAQKTASQQELALSEAKMARAEAKMKLAQAELNFTSFRAPFDGLLGRLQEQEGSVVKDDTVVTTLSDNGTMWVYFNMPESRYLEFMSGRGKVKEGVPVELVLANGTAFPQAGKLAAIEGQFQDDTGTIAFRADFPNPDGLLRHGQTGNAVIRESLKNVIVIPRRAAFPGSNKQYVYVVRKDDVIEKREIVVQNEVGDVLVVKKGLDANDRIVIEGLLHIRDGEKVTGFEFRKPGDVK